MTENKRLANFCEKWKSLSNLDTLKISAKYEKTERLFAQAFIKLILKSVQNLVDFELDLQQVEDWNWAEYNIDNKNPICLTQIFQACQNYPDKLQKVKLSFNRKYPLAFPTVEGINFPKLTSLQLQNNEIPDVVTLQNIFGLVKKPVPEADDHVVVHLLLEKFVVKSNQALLNLLETLLKAPRNAKTELTIEVRKLSFGSFDKMFEAFIAKMKKIPALRNISLEVNIIKNFYGKGLKALSFMKEMFGNVQFSEKYALMFSGADDSESGDGGEKEPDDCEE